MRKHKAKLIAGVVILAVLAGAWFYGGSLITGTGEASPAALSAQIRDALAQTADVAGISLSATASHDTELEQDDLDEPLETDEDAMLEINPLALEEDDEAAQAENETPDSTPQPNATPTPTPPAQAAEAPPADDGTFTVTLSVRVDTILNNMHLLDEAKHGLVPTNGVIFPTTQVTVTAGESVFDVLQREMRRAGIHMSSRFTPMYNSAYVEGINNLFEFDVGPLSGWMYRVNGWFPNFGSSQYELEPGDVIEWLYTVDLGRDIGGGF